MPCIKLSIIAELLDEIELNQDETDKINDLLLTSLNDLGIKKRKIILNKVNEFTRGRNSINKPEILEWIQNTLNIEILSELQEKIGENKTLLDLINSIFFKKLIE
ncbi:MAG: hypothetical protein ACTSWY_00690 [Promethearchaeota archaeon]